MRTKTIETRWNEYKKYLQIIHFALCLSSEPLSEGDPSTRDNFASYKRDLNPLTAE